MIWFRGFPNYFGMQRFGTGRVPSSVLGLALLRKQHRSAVELLLGARARRGRALAAFQKASEGDFAAALAQTPSSCLQERQVLEHLVQQSDFETAVRAVPRHLRLLWCRALASEVFNRLLSAALTSGTVPDTLPLPGYGIEMEPKIKELYEKVLQDMELDPKVLLLLSHHSNHLALTHFKSL